MSRGRLIIFLALLIFFIPPDQSFERRPHEYSSSAVGEMEKERMEADGLENEVKDDRFSNEVMAGPAAKHHQSSPHHRHGVPWTAGKPEAEVTRTEGHHRHHHHQHHNHDRVDQQQQQQQHHDNDTNKCWVSRFHRGCSCTRFHDNFSINCSNAGLSAVPKKWTDIGDFITTLNLEKNHIREINEGDFYGVKIRRLLLANNSLTDLKLLAFWGLTTSLETLDLSYNKLRTVPSESAKLLINLKTLVLTGNEIDYLGAHDIGFWKKLEVLTLDNNPILSIHSSCIAGTKSLSFLSLDNLKLTDKVHDIAQMETNNIKGLSLTRNGISVLPARWSKNFTSLTLLNLGHNHIVELSHEETFYGPHETLKNLDLHRNRINKIPIAAIRKLIKLNVLDLSGNRISRVKKRSFNESKNLQLLDLSHNRISKISKKAFVGLDSIQKLDLRFNRLITLDDKVFGWNFASPKYFAGKQVYLGGNPWLCNCVLNWLSESIKASRLHQNAAGKERTKRGKRDKHDTIHGHNNNNNIHSNSNNNNKLETTGIGERSDGMNIFADDPLCDRPAILKGTPLSLLNEEDLTCNHDYYYYEDDEATTQTTVAAVATVAVVDATATTTTATAIQASFSSSSSSLELSVAYEDEPTPL